MNEIMLQLCQDLCRISLEMDMAAKKQFMYDLLHHNFNSESEIRILTSRWNIGVDSDYQVCVIDVGKWQKNIDEVAEICQEFVDRRYRSSILSVTGEQIIILLELLEEGGRANTKENMIVLSNRIDDTQKEFEDATIHIGIGRIYHGAKNISRSFQEAKQSILLGEFIKRDNRVTGYDELGILKLLSHINLEEQDDFCQEVLGVLMDYDSQHNTDMVHTLEMYYLCKEDLQQTAEQLYMHSNTLRKRLRKIEEVLGGSLDDSEIRVKCYLACQIGRMLKMKCL